jgi:hypothetical protein
MSRRSNSLMGLHAASCCWYLGTQAAAAAAAAAAAGAADWYVSRLVLANVIGIRT